MTNTPTAFDLSSLLGQSGLVPSINFSFASDASAFKTFVPNTPEVDFSWRFFGVLRISTAGSYTICSSSDDGSMVYINTGSGSDPALADYTQIVNNDGLHSIASVCSDPLSLESRSYDILVRLTPLLYQCDLVLISPDYQGTVRLAMTCTAGYWFSRWLGCGHVVDIPRSRHWME